MLTEDDWIMIGVGAALIVTAWILFMAGLLRMSKGDPPKPKEKQHGK